MAKAIFIFEKCSTHMLTLSCSIFFFTISLQFSYILLIISRYCNFSHYHVKSNSFPFLRSITYYVYNKLLIVLFNIKGSENMARFQFYLQNFVNRYCILFINQKVNIYYRAYFHDILIILWDYGSLLGFDPILVINSIFKIFDLDHFQNQGHKYSLYF